MRRPPRFDHNQRTYIMGVLNVTPDSFSDGGRFLDKAVAVKHALDMVRSGADIIDVGGESTRPGSDPVSEKEELSRVIPVIKSLAKKTRAYISVDTSKSAVAEEAIRAGAAIVNDVSGLKRDPRIASVVAKYGSGLIIMHMRGKPKDMQNKPHYDDVVEEVIKDLRRSIDRAVRSGIPVRNIIIDPGIGFGKSLEHNLAILNRLSEFKTLKLPICIGTSKKSFIGKALGDRYPGERLVGTIATSVIAIMNGAGILRVHDPRELSSASRMADRVIRSGVN